MNIQPRPNSNGMAWRLRWEIRDPATGKRKQISETVRGTKDVAKRRWREKQAEIDKLGKAYREPSKEPLREYMARWLAGKRPDLRPTTYKQYESLTRTNILPSLGALPLCEIVPDVLQEWIDSLRTKGLAPRTVNSSRGVLHDAMQDALRLGTILSNPVERTRGARLEKSRADAFTIEEGERLFTAAASSRFLNLFRFAFFSGLRKGEILQLKWQDVDRDAGTVTVRESKTDAGLRRITLSSPAVDALRAQWLQQAKERLAAGPRWQDQGLVFSTTTGGRLSPYNTYRDFCRYRDAASLPKLTFHGLRHTAVSVEIAAGVSPAVLSKRIGHKNIGTTIDRYGHLLPQADQEAAAKVDEYLRGQKGAKTPSN